MIFLVDLERARPGPILSGHVHVRWVAGYTNFCKVLKGCCSGVAGAVLISISVPESYFRVYLYAYTVRDIASQDLITV